MKTLHAKKLSRKAQVQSARATKQEPLDHFKRVSDVIRDAEYKIEVIAEVMRSRTNTLYYSSSLHGMEVATEDQRTKAINALIDYVDLVVSDDPDMQGTDPLEWEHVLDLYAWRKDELPDFNHIAKCIDTGDGFPTLQSEERRAKTVVKILAALLREVEQGRRIQFKFDDKDAASKIQKLVQGIRDGMNIDPDTVKKVLAEVAALLKP